MDPKQPIEKPNGNNLNNPNEKKEEEEKQLNIPTSGGYSVWNNAISPIQSWFDVTRGSFSVWTSTNPPGSEYNPFARPEPWMNVPVVNRRVFDQHDGIRWSYDEQTVPTAPLQYNTIHFGPRVNPMQNANWIYSHSNFVMNTPAIQSNVQQPIRRAPVLHYPGMYAASFDPNRNYASVVATPPPLHRRNQLLNQYAANTYSNRGNTAASTTITPTHVPPLPYPGPQCAADIDSFRRYAATGAVAGSVAAAEPVAAAGTIDAAGAVAIAGSDDTAGYVAAAGSDDTTGHFAAAGSVDAAEAVATTGSVAAAGFLETTGSVAAAESVSDAPAEVIARPPPQTEVAEDALCDCLEYNQNCVGCTAKKILANLPIGKPDLEMDRRPPNPKAAEENYRKLKEFSATSAPYPYPYDLWKITDDYEDLMREIFSKRCDEEDE